MTLSPGKFTKHSIKASGRDILEENDHKIWDIATSKRSDNCNLNFKQREEYFVSSQLIKHPRFYAFTRLSKALLVSSLSKES